MAPSHPAHAHPLGRIGRLGIGPRAAWERWKARATPPGALTFHFEAWSRRSLSAVSRDRASAAMGKLGVDHVLALHGSALQHDGRATLLCGPSGIGKSTLLHRLERDGAGTLVEDGVVLVAERDGTWLLVTTGTGTLMCRSRRGSRQLRRLSLLDGVSWLDTCTPGARRRGRLTALVLRRISWLAFMLAVATSRGERETFTPATIPVAHLLVVFHGADPLTAVKVHSNGVVEKVTDPRDGAPPGLKVTSILPAGDREELVVRLRAAICSPEG